MAKGRKRVYLCFSVSSYHSERTGPESVRAWCVLNFQARILALKTFLSCFTRVNLSRTPSFGKHDRVRREFWPWLGENFGVLSSHWSYGAGDRALNFLLALLEAEEVDLERFRAALPEAIQTALYYERKNRLFAASCPHEPEMNDALVGELAIMKEAIGGVCLFLEGTDKAGKLSELCLALRQSGANASKCLRAQAALMGEQEAIFSHTYIGGLILAVQTEDAELFPLELREVLHGMFATVRGLESLFAPHSWRESRLIPLLDILEQLGGSEQSLTVEEWKSLFARFEVLELAAWQNLPTLNGVRDGVLREILSLLGAVYEGRVSVGQLNFEEHEQKLAELLGACSEAVGAFRHTVQHQAVQHFPVLWDYLAPNSKPGAPAESDFSVAAAGALQGYLTGSASEEEFVSAMACAKRLLAGLPSRERLGRALTLCRTVLQRPRGDQLGEFERLSIRIENNLLQVEGI